MANYADEDRTVAINLVRANSKGFMPITPEVRVIRLESTVANHSHDASDIRVYVTGLVRQLTEHSITKTVTLVEVEIEKRDVRLSTDVKEPCFERDRVSITTKRGELRYPNGGQD